METHEGVDRRFLLGGLAGVAGISALAAMAKGGPLNPPAGPVAPTGKTLTEVEPRIPINDTTCPGTATHRYVISSRGSYYLTDNVVAGPGVIALNIQADCDVDLNGYIIAGGPQTSASISIPGYSRLRLRNGMVGGQGGVVGEGNSCVLEDLWFTMLAINPVTNGRGVSLTGRATVRNCVIQKCSESGIMLGTQSLIESCFLYSCGIGVRINGGAGSVVRGCVFSDCNYYGMEVVMNGSSNGYTRISNNLIRNSYRGIVNDANGCIIEDNVLQAVYDAAVVCNSSGNVIVRNIVTGSPVPFLLAAGNRYGPIMNIPGAGTPAVNGASAASTMGSADPTANFVF